MFNHSGMIFCLISFTMWPFIFHPILLCRYIIQNIVFIIIDILNTSWLFLSANRLLLFDTIWTLNVYGVKVLTESLNGTNLIVGTYEIASFSVNTLNFSIALEFSLIFVSNIAVCGFVRIPKIYTIC